MANAACQLYQLFSKRRVPNGAYVGVNGPHDKFGYIVTSKVAENGEFLNLIRGCVRRPGQPVAAQF